MAIKTYSNEQIKKGVVDQFYWDSRINASKINVDVSDGLVTLTGQVPSYSSKLAAESDALTIPGVTSVMNNLEIQQLAAGELPPDEEIKNNVSSSLKWNTNIESENIKVSSENGTVILEGTVPSYWQKILAEELIYDIAGVNDAENKLSVVPSESIIDESIAEAIVNSVDKDPNVNVDYLNVKVEDGVVTLSGTVFNWAAYYNVLNRARYTVGVVNVINKLHME